MNKIMVTATTCEKSVVCEMKHNGYYLIEKYPLKNESRFPLKSLLKSACKLYWRDAVIRFKKYDLKGKLIKIFAEL